MSTEVVVEVLNSTSSGPFLPWTKLPTKFAGKWVKLTIVDRPADTESTMQKRHDKAFAPPREVL